MTAAAPLPVVTMEYSVEPHPDPIVRALIEEIERLRAENRALKERLQDDGPYPR